MDKIYCVRADFGKYAHEFINGGYVGIGWLWGTNLSHIQSKDDLYPLYKAEYPNDISNVVIGQQVGQIARFLLELQEGTFVITPSSDTDFLYYGTIEKDSYYYADEDNCPYRHRKKVKWEKKPILRSEFSVPFQNTMRSSLTVFAVNHKNNFFEVIGRNDLIPKLEKEVKLDYYKSVLGKILELHDKEFEILVTHILSAMGFEGSEHTGRVGDGGVDATGELDVSGLAKIKIFVQAKRYKLGLKINHNVVKNLRSNIPSGGQGAFITTAEFQKRAQEIANEPGFPRIGLINGEQLVDILTVHWTDIPDDFKEKLGLKIGLVIS
ncbi:restriction endonuclease [Pedobacter riviphilus]|uniref:Restriction endonuclease n=1 Tax=Pedobacter riviphilus TaxID=2766984 RepID=A0ABX6TP79_9SPHI|nr:restriction endonuclease [Pedobacter riviphilus]QNR86758.1 restriction endonuclease [Pedobacter riviphilus]